MNKRLSAIGFILVFTAFMVSAQNAKPPRVSTSVGIYDVQSREEIHNFSAEEIRELVRMENARYQSVGAFPHPILVYCFEERIFRYTGGKFQNEAIKYRLRTPQNVRSGKKYPLIVHLHGNGDDSLTHLHPILPLLIGPEQQDCFVLVTQGWEGWSFRTTQDGPLDIVMAALEHVLAENPIDKKRISLTGISGGGWGVWELLQRYPDMFAGAVPTACGAPSSPQRLAALKRTRIWAFFNKGDVNRESLQAAKRMINGSGGSMEFTALNEPGHNAFTPAIETYDCLRWALAQNRGSWFSPPPGVRVKKPHSLLLVSCLYILPCALTIFLAWGGIYERISTAYQSVRKRLGMDEPYSSPILDRKISAHLPATQRKAMGSVNTKKVSARIPNEPCPVRIRVSTP